MTKCDNFNNSRCLAGSPSHLDKNCLVGSVQPKPGFGIGNKKTRSNFGIGNGAETFLSETNTFF